MLQYQEAIIIIFAIINILFFVRGYVETTNKKAFKWVPYILMIFGIFVWGDAVIISSFFVLASLFSLIVGSWILFLLVFSSFWLVRSSGETIYFFNQQFSSIQRQPPRSLPGFRFYQNHSVWFAYQIFHQCIVIVSLLLTIYLVHLWLLI
jgi:hypothetical protein